MASVTTTNATSWASLEVSRPPHWDQPRPRNIPQATKDPHIQKFHSLQKGMREATSAKPAGQSCD